MTAREFKTFLEEVERGPNAAAMDKPIEMACGTLYRGGPLTQATVEIIPPGVPLIFIWDEETTNVR